MNEAMEAGLLKEAGDDAFARSYMRVWLTAIRVSIKLEGEFGKSPYVKVEILRNKHDVSYRVSVRLLTAHVTRDIVLDTTMANYDAVDGPRLSLLEQALYRAVVYEFQHPPQGGMGIL